MSAPNRREVLACLACTCALAACTGPTVGDTADTGDTGGGVDTDFDPSAIPGGHVDDLAVGDLEAVGHGVAVGRDEDGYYSLSTICTHRGCDMANRGSVSGSGLICDCHGSRFRVDGSVSRGPARDPLPFHPLEIGTDGAITVDSEIEIESDVRFTPPELA